MKKSITKKEKISKTKWILLGTGMCWGAFASIYLLWLYRPSFKNPMNLIEHSAFKQEQIIENLDEFKSITDLYLVPVGLIGLGLTYHKYKKDKILSRKKSAHELVLRVLKNLYDLRTNLERSDIYCYRDKIDEISQKDQNTINFSLNILEELCIAVDQGVVDSEIINLNLVSILAEYRFAFDEYIESKQAGLRETVEQKYLPWGILTCTIDQEILKLDSINPKIEAEQNKGKDTEEIKNLVEMIESQAETKTVQCCQSSQKLNSK